MYPNNYGYGNPGYGNQGYGNQGYGQPMPMNQPYGMGMNPGMGMGMGMGGLQGHYMFSQQMIDMQARIAFMKFDMNRNGLLNINELRMALNDFSMMNGQMPIMEPDLHMLMSIFDVDGSGQIDYYEFECMLKHMAGIQVFERNMMMGMRGQRGMRMQQYNSFW